MKHEMDHQSYQFSMYWAVQKTLKGRNPNTGDKQKRFQQPMHVIKIIPFITKII